MKPPVLFSVITAMVILFASGGCGRKDSLYPFRWEKTDPLSDSLTLALDSSLYVCAPTDSMRLLLSRLEKQARNNPRLKGRVDYFRGGILEREDRDEEGVSILRSLLEKTDSASEPYLYNRLLDQLTPDEVSPEVYTSILARLDYFRSIGDDFLTGAALIDLANLLKDINDTDGALSAYAEADSMIRKAGFPRQADPIEINRAITYQISGDTARASSLFHRLLEKPEFSDNVSMKYVILSNLLTTLHDTVAGRQMLEMQLEAGGDVDCDCSLATFLSDIEYDRGNYREALRLGRIGYWTSITEGNDDVRAIAMRRLANAFAVMGNNDSAYYYLSRAVVVEDSLNDVRRPDEIQATETGRIIAQRKMERELERGKQVLWVAMVLFVVFVCVIGGAGVMVWRMQQLRLRHARDIADMEKAHRRLIATQILVDEKNALLNTLSKDLSDLEEKGEISAGTKGHIAAPIKTHIVQAGNRENFLETFSELHPEFSSRLRERAPDITDTDIRLAKYIAVGLESKQIASTLGIRPESVKQARWRLRSKLRLATGESLEGCLKNLL